MTRFARADMEVLADRSALAERVADWLLEAARAAEGRFAVSLSGGSTPRALYALLAQPPYLERFPWARTHWFWGDERFVAHEDPESNCRMVREAMLSKVPAPAANIHPIPTEGVSAEAAAANYERELKAFYGADSIDPVRPIFDVTLLGLGTDGHTASLFPGSPAVDERERWAASAPGAGGRPRITLTYPVLESSRRTAFLVAGVDKREVFRRLRTGAADLPAARLHPAGSLRLFVDVAAATEV